MTDAKRVIILRGISGAGKSTYTSRHFPGAMVCSADQYFISPDGNYKFDPKKLGSAHGSCKRKFKKALEALEPLVVVDNTNLRRADYKDYVRLAKDHGYEVYQVVLRTQYKNVHGVPESTLERMKKNFEVDTEIPEWPESGNQ